MSHSRVPVTLVTGFLGSGKTTIIAHLIDDLIAQGVKVVFVKNEVGDEDLDGLIMKGKHIQTRELLNGCICCTLVGPFISAIDELIATTQPERIIIEASGTAETASIALMISTHPSLIRDGVITIIDVVNYEGSQDLSVTTRHQAQFTDLIVFNKVELVDLEQKERVVGYVREVNEHAPIVEAPNGRVNPELVFGIGSTQLQTELEEYQQAEINEHEANTNHDHDHDDGDGPHPEHSSHLAADGIEGFHYQTSLPFDEAALTAAIDTLPKAILRVKGIVRTVTKEDKVVNRIGQRTVIEPLSTLVATPLPAGFQSKLIFIGFHAPTFKEEVVTLIKSAERDAPLA